MSVVKPSMGRIGLGTYRLGKKTISACLQALEIGYRHIDTAALYRNEKKVAQAIELSGLKREVVFVTSKIKVKDIKAGNLETAARNSLDNLGRIDLLLLHAPTSNLVEAWEQMLAIGQWQEIGQVGVSNFAIDHLQQLKFHPPKWNQIEIRPYLQRPALVKYCQQNQIQIVAHSPLIKAQKLLCDRLLSIAQEIHRKPSQLLIAWSLAKGYIVLPRSSQLAHLQENFEATQIDLPQSIIKKLDCLEEGHATHPQHIFNP